MHAARVCFITGLSQHLKQDFLLKYHKEYHKLCSRVNTSACSSNAHLVPKNTCAAPLNPANGSLSSATPNPSQRCNATSAAIGALWGCCRGAVEAGRLDGVEQVLRDCGGDGVQRQRFMRRAFSHLRLQDHHLLLHPMRTGTMSIASKDGASPDLCRSVERIKGLLSTANAPYACNACFVHTCNGTGVDVDQT